jgi:hypothetical protein
VCRTGSRGHVRPASIRHQVAARSSGRVQTSAASPLGGAETHHWGASWRRQCDCPHGTPAIKERNVLKLWHGTIACDMSGDNRASLPSQSVQQYNKGLHIWKGLLWTWTRSSISTRWQNFWPVGKLRNFQKLPRTTDFVGY